MPAISGYFNSRSGNSSQVLRAQNSNNAQQNGKSGSASKANANNEARKNSAFADQLNLSDSTKSGSDQAVKDARAALDQIKGQYASDVEKTRPSEEVVFEQSGSDSRHKFKVDKELRVSEGTYELQVDFAGESSRHARTKLEIEADGRDVVKSKSKTAENIREQFQASGEIEIEFESKGRSVDRVRLLKLNAAEKDLGEVRGQAVSDAKQALEQLGKAANEQATSSDDRRDIQTKLDAATKKLDGLVEKSGSLDDEQFTKQLEAAFTSAVDDVGTKLGNLAPTDSGEVVQTGGGVDNAKLDALGEKVTANGKKIDDLGSKFDSLKSDVGGKVDRVSKEVADLGNRLDVRDSENNERVKETNSRIDDAGKKIDSRVDDLEGKVNDRFDSTDKKIDDLGNAVDDRLDATDQKIDDLGNAVDNRLDQTDQKIDDLGNAVDDRLDATDQKIDDLGNSVEDRFDDVDSKLNDISNQLGGQVNDVSGDLATAITELKEVIKEVDSNNDSKLSDTVKDLKADFNNQFNDLKTQHEAESKALLDKLDEVTTALKTLSEQSTEQIAILKDKLGGLGGQLGVVINKIDALGQGGLSQRSIGLFNVAAKVGNGALDKLIGVVGPGNTGNQLRSAQSRLQSVSARFGASGQAASGLNLLA